MTLYNLSTPIVVVSHTGEEFRKVIAIEGRMITETEEFTIVEPTKLYLATTKPEEVCSVMAKFNYVELRKRIIVAYQNTPLTGR